MTTITEKWLKKVRKAEKKLKDKHRPDAEKAEKHYYNDEANKVELPIYWSSVQVQRSALYAQPPNPEIRSRNNDVNNPQSKEISKTLEEAISYQIDQSDFHSDAKRGVLDFLVTDLGVCRVRLDVETSQVANPFLEGGVEDVITHQDVYIDHWPWERFIYDIGKDWQECDWICYVHYMTASEVKKQFDHDISKQALNVTKDEKNGKVTVYEIWDKEKRTVYDIYEGKDTPLRVRKDPLNLKDFYDCPKPLISNMRSAKFIPQSDYKQIARQLEIINKLEARIDRLTETIKYRGMYESSITGLAKLEKAPDGKFVPVEGLLAMLGGGNAANFDKAIATLPIIEQAQVVQILQQQKTEAKEQIYEITGLSDIIRGNTKASETATAQQIKGQWASVRLQDKQSAINSWLRAIMRLYAEIISEHFTADVLTRMTGVEVTPEMMQIMKNDTLRCYSIDVETDSTIQSDEAQEKQDRMEMVNAFLPILQNIMPAVQQNMMPMEMGKAILLSVIRGFKYTRSLEDMIEGLGDNMSQLQQLQQQLQQQGQQAQQMDMQYQQQLQQAQGMIQQLQGELNNVNMRKEQREDMDKQAEVAKDYAETEKKKAETAKIWQEIQAPMQIGMDAYRV